MARKVPSLRGSPVPIGRCIWGIVSDRGNNGEQKVAFATISPPNVLDPVGVLCLDLETVGVTCVWVLSLPAGGSSFVLWSVWGLLW